MLSSRVSALERAELEAMAAGIPEVALFVESVRGSKWGIVRPRRDNAAD